MIKPLRQDVLDAPMKTNAKHLVTLERLYAWSIACLSLASITVVRMAILGRAVRVVWASVVAGVV